MREKLTITRKNLKGEDGLQNIFYKNQRKNSRKPRPAFEANEPLTQ